MKDAARGYEYRFSQGECAVWGVDPAALYADARARCPECPICLEELPAHDSDAAVVLSCRHLACRTCWDTYADMRAEQGLASHCPLCRARVHELVGELVCCARASAADVTAPGYSALLADKAKVASEA